LGILPGESTVSASPHVLIPLATGMGQARNNINVLASDLILVCAFALGPGTLSEIALAIKARKTILVLTDHPPIMAFLEGFDDGRLQVIDHWEKAPQLMINEIERFLDKKPWFPIRISKAPNNN